MWKPDLNCVRCQQLIDDGTFKARPCAAKPCVASPLMQPELIVWWEMLKLLHSELFQGERLVLLKRAKATENDITVFVELENVLQNELSKKRKADRDLNR